MRVTTTHQRTLLQHSESFIRNHNILYQTQYNLNLKNAQPHPRAWARTAVSCSRYRASPAAIALSASAMRHVTVNGGTVASGPEAMRYPPANIAPRKATLAADICGDTQVRH
jgi:hypothetical protein